MIRPANAASPVQMALFRSKGKPAVKAHKPAKRRVKTAEQKPMRPRAELLAVWDATLAAPPASGIDRRDGVGSCVCRWVLPLELCIPTNRLRRMPPWRYGQVRQALLDLMRAQLTAYGTRVTEPLGGRPMVRCIRFSPVESDPGSGFEKQIVDLLQPTRWRKNSKTGEREPVPGLALIWSDRGTALARDCHWEPCGSGDSGVLLELWKP